MPLPPPRSGAYSTGPRRTATTRGGAALSVRSPSDYNQRYDQGRTATGRKKEGPAPTLVTSIGTTRGDGDSYGQGSQVRGGGPQDALGRRTVEERNKLY